MTQKRLDQEYTELVAEWTEAEAVRQRFVDRLRTLDERFTIADPMWDEWGKADELAGSAREAVRSFLAANAHGWQP